MQTTKQTQTQQQGFAHLGLVIAVVGVLAIGGLVAWRFMSAQDGKSSGADAFTQKLASAKCEYDDKDICKFFVSFKEHKKYKMSTASTDKTTGEKSTMLFEIDGENTHSVMTGTVASETIMIGKLTTYTKSPNGTWWKQTRKETPNQPAQENSSPAVDLKEPEEDNESQGVTTYKALGKEACGKLTCFKYQVIGGDTGSTEYIWFDTKAYQLRRTTSDSPELASDTTYSFDSVTVKAPATFKELGENQYIMPGENEPSTIPTGGDYLNGM